MEQSGMTYQEQEAARQDRLNEVGTEPPEAQILSKRERVLVLRL